VAKKLKQTWDGRVNTWHHNVTNSPGFEAIREEILRRAQPGPEDTCVELGAGTGFLTFPLAEAAGSVLAVDVSQAMTDRLDNEAKRAGRATVTAITSDVTRFSLPRQSVDLVVSNYVLHHVHNADKRAIVRQARRWLRPGGRMVVGDMMFGRGLSEGDGAILRAKARSLAAKGPGGYWRIAKNLLRYALRVGHERPAPPQFWIKAFEDAGFRDVNHVQVVEEAGVVWGHL
jgi:ubiquinone/menaquinone biosynthesis C-methylase UbiE